MTAGAGTTERPTAGATRGLLTIGDVAERTGLSLRTVRYYEEVGLLPVAERSPGGFRLYTDDAVERLLLVKQTKPLELTLEQVRDLLDTVEALREPRDGTSADSARRTALLEVLAGYQVLVDERVATLRARLLGARALQTSLDELLLA